GYASFGWASHFVAKAAAPKPKARRRAYLLAQLHTIAYCATRQSSGAQMQNSESDDKRDPSSPREEVVRPAAGDLRDETKRCRVCGERIWLGARKCTHCNTDFTWRRYLAFSNTTLALITAL